MINLETLEQVVEIIKDNPISEITIDDGQQKIYLKNSARTIHQHSVDQAEDATAALAVSMPAPEPEPIIDTTIIISSPLVGTFHTANLPLKVGSEVRGQSVIGTIESLRIVNDVRSNESGRVVEVFIEDNSPVEYGQALYRLAPSK